MGERAEKAVRVPMTLIERATALVPLLQATAWGDAVKWNETALVRLALSRGLDVLEEELAARPVSNSKLAAAKSKR